MTERIDPGSTIGILGGGQLGRLLALAAGKMGYRSHIFCPENDCPAAQVADAHTNAAYDDIGALQSFADDIQVVTSEFENVPAETLRIIGGQNVPVRPSSKALEIAQDRSLEKKFFNDIGAETAPWQPIHSMEEATRALEEIGVPAILKTARLGYDGKGQAAIDTPDKVEAVWHSIGGEKAIEHMYPFAVVEGFVDFDCEISVIGARGVSGEVRCFEPVRNVHRNHILYTTTAPAAVAADVGRRAEEIVTEAVNALELVGLLAVEMFVTKTGEVLVNEMAPRPHNSGHWTLDGCVTDQFTQLVRAICGLPLADPARHSDAVMTNILGEDMDSLDALLNDAAANVYMYGKSEARKGRKMGHVTRLTPIGRR